MKHISRKSILYIPIILSALIVLTCLFFACFSGSGQKGRDICINEVCSSNIHAFNDDEENHPDYVELYNSGEKELDLGGWKISDNKNNEDPWGFPEVSIPSKGFLILYADGTERKTYPDEHAFSIRSFIMTGNGYMPEDTGLHLSFTIPSKGGELFLSDPHNNLIDSVSIPELKYDTVYARRTDGEAVFKILTPTPGESNDKAMETVFPSLSRPAFSASSGFYDDPFDLAIASADGGEIRYTLDGSEPGPDSFLYDGSIRIEDVHDKDNVYSRIRNTSVYLYDYYDKKGFHIPDDNIDKCTVVRAAVFTSDGRRSETVTEVYFVGFDEKEMYRGYKVMSITADPSDLFGSEKGIYVLGDIGEKDLLKKGRTEFNRGSDGNYMQHGIAWERECELVLFSKDHKEAEIKQKAGIRIKGNSSRQYPMKGFNLYARNAYSGKDRFDASFIEGKKAGNRISLSAGGNDYYTLTKDSFVSRRVKSTGIDVAAQEFGDPVYLFLNGEFWGVYIIAERMDESFFKENYGIEEDNIVFIKEGEVAAGKPGDIHYYFVFLSLFEDKDFSDDEQYRELKEAVDIDSLIDYYSLRIYSEYGIDWPHLNMGFFRSKEPGDGEYEDCRWRFANFDNNNSLNLNKIDADMMKVMFEGSENFGPDQVFTSLMRNSEFREQFGKRFKEVTELLFRSEDAKRDLKDTEDALRIPVSSSYKRWFGSDTSFDEDFFDEKCGGILEFIEKRGSYIDPKVEEKCRK